MAVAVLVLVAAGARLQVGHAGNTTTNTKFYSSTMPLPSTMGAGASATTTLTLTNLDTPPYVSQQTLGLEYVSIPSGFTVVPSASTVYSHNGGGTWTVTIANGYIQLVAASSKDALAPGDWVSVDLTVSATCTAASGTWTTYAKQSNNFNGPPGNDFTQELTTDPSVTVSGVGCHFGFSTIASPQTAGQQISFTVSELDGLNNPAHFADSANLTSNFLTTHGTPVLSTPLSFGTSGTQASATATTYTTQTGAKLTVSTTDGSISNYTSFDVQPNAASYLKFTTQPTDTVKNVAIPTFKVTVYDQWGNTETRSDQAQNIEVCIGNDAGSSPPTALSGTTLQADGCVQQPTPTSPSATGVATYSDVALNETGIGFTLTAQAGTLTGDTSSAFTVFDGCPAGVSSCSADNSSQTNGNPNTDITTNYPTPSGESTKIQMSAVSQSVTCGGTTSDSLGSEVTFVPPTGQNNVVYGYKNPITVTFEWDKSVVLGTGVSNFVFCYTKPTLSGFIQVPLCPKKLTSDTQLPCELHRNRDNAGDLIITMLAGTNDPTNVVK